LVPFFRESAVTASAPKHRNFRSGKLVVLVIIALGLVLGLVGLRYRNAARPVRPLTKPSTSAACAEHRIELCKETGVVVILEANLHV
jgi:hypothetical protein